MYGTKENNEKMKRALITGITGQMGSYLAEYLLENNYEVFGLVRRSSSEDASLSRIKHIQHSPKLKLIHGDLADSESVHRTIAEVMPNEIYNLAAQSHVALSFKVPEYTANIGALGVLRICEAVRKINKNIKIYQASTSELFGGIHGRAVNENDSFYPKSPYGIAKLFAFWTMKNYREAYDMFCSNGIMFNTESPKRGENFVTRKITMGVAEIVRGNLDKLQLGNLNAKRDWNHVRDVIKAMHLILQAPKPNDYVIGSGETHSIREFVELAFKHAGIEIAWKGEGLDEVGYEKTSGKVYVTVNPEFFRPAEVDVLIADASKIKKELGWKPEYNFQQIVKEMMEHDLR